MRITEHSLSQFESKFVVLQPANAWTAVVRGAVLSSLEGKMVHSRKARRHYGIKVCSKYDEDIHSEQNKYWDVHEEEFKATNQISWHVQRGDDLPTETPVLLGFYRTWNFHDTVPEYTNISIIVSDAIEAPDEYEQDTDTRVLCKLKVNLGSVERKHFREHINSTGIRYRSLTYKIGLSVRSGAIIFDLRVGGVVLGSVKVDFE